MTFGRPDIHISIREGDRRIKLGFGVHGVIRIRTNQYSDDVHEGLVRMLQHLREVGKVDLWRGLAAREIDALELYRRYVRDELDGVIRVEQVKPAKAAMLEWASKRLNPTTAKSYKEVIANLFRDHPDATIAELPEVLKAVRDRYEAKGQKNTFDQCRKVASSWAGKKYLNNQPLWRQLRAVPPLDRSSHVHRQEGRAVWDVFATVKKMGEPFGPQFLTMCLIGAGTKEYLTDGFSVELDEDHNYEYVRIHGEKTAHRNRRVPLIYAASELRKPSIKYANRDRFDKALQAVQPDWDLYDARRTFRHWCDLAGINEIRAKAYSGRLSLTVDERYRRHNIDPYIEDDAATLRKYIESNIERPKPKTERKPVPRLPTF